VGVPFGNVWVVRESILEFRKRGWWYDGDVLSLLIPHHVCYRSSEKKIASDVITWTAGEKFHGKKGNSLFLQTLFDAFITRSASRETRTGLKNVQRRQGARREPREASKNKQLLFFLIHRCRFNSSQAYFTTRGERMVPFSRRSSNHLLPPKIEGET